MWFLRIGTIVLLLVGLDLWVVCLIWVFVGFGFLGLVVIGCLILSLCDCVHWLFA